MRFRLDVYVDGATLAKTLAEDVQRGLGGVPRTVPPKYFYDEAGSRLFERITRLPEYYLTRVETALLDALGETLMRRVAPADVVELGSGASTKMRRLLDAADGAAPPLRYVPVDVDAAAVHRAARGLLRRYPSLRVHGVVADFERHLAYLPSAVGRRLVLFLGSTIGNLDPPARQEFLGHVRRLLQPGDRLLLGLDLVKDTATLERAYNDAAGVTAAFNRNVLRVVNRALAGDFKPAAFRHRAWYDERAGRIEMHLVATARQTVHLRSLGLTVEVAPGESIWTESSYKFTRESAGAMLERAGLALERWDTDAASRFALALAAPADE